jgi:hypothetical protein
MLQLTITIGEAFDEAKSEFIEPKTVELQLEHSLVSVSKWESKWELPFLSLINKTQEQTLDYIVMMNLQGDFPPELLSHITSDQINQINDYINAKMSATTFREVKSPPSTEIVTNELVYYWLVALNIPFECQHWHLNRLLTLIKVCNLKNQPGKKMTKGEIAAQNRSLNEQRRAALNSKG